jgi:hypothetical protein
MRSRRAIDRGKRDGSVVGCVGSQFVALEDTLALTLLLAEKSTGEVRAGRPAPQQAARRGSETRVLGRARVARPARGGSPRKPPSATCSRSRRAPVARARAVRSAGEAARSGGQGRREGDRLSSPNTMRASGTELPCDRPWRACVRSFGRRHSGLSPESNGLRLSEALPLKLKARLLLGRNRSMEPARDIPPKSATQDAAPADALRRATASQSTWIVNPSDEAHAGSLRRNSARLDVPFSRPAHSRWGFVACHALM